MIKNQEALTKIMELYEFLLSVDVTTYRQIKEKFNIGSNHTVRKYLDLIQYMFNVTVETSSGVGGGTRIKRSESARVHLTTDQQCAVTAVLENESIDLWIRKEMYKILFGIGNKTVAATYLEDYKCLLSVNDND